MIAVAASLALAFGVLWGLCGIMCFQHFGTWRAAAYVAVAPLLWIREGGELGAMSLCVLSLTLGLCIAALVKPKSGMIVGGAFVSLLVYVGWSMVLIGVSV